QRKVLQFYRDAESALSSIPGIRSVAIGSDLPLAGFDIGQPVEIAGDPPVDPANRHGVGYLMVSTRYFDALGITILQVRAFTDRATASSPPVCIVNEAFVQRYLAGRPAVGAVAKVPPMAPGMTTAIPREIVGVIRQVTVSIGEKEKGPQLYVPLEQNAWYS